jgi:hypothetical protein
MRRDQRREVGASLDELVVLARLHYRAIPHDLQVHTYTFAVINLASL